MPEVRALWRVAAVDYRCLEQILKIAYQAAHLLLLMHNTKRQTCCVHPCNISAVLKIRLWLAKKAAHSTPQQ
jgi:hypothetical protein